MNKSNWKKLEMDAAKLFGMTRTPLSGGNSKITRADAMRKNPDCPVCGKRLYEVGETDEWYCPFCHVKHHIHVPEKKVFIECKKRKSHAIHALYLDTKKKALAEGKIPVVVTKETGKHTTLITTEVEYMKRIVEEMKDGHNV